MFQNKHILISIIIIIIIALVTIATFFLYYWWHQINNQDCFIHINKDTTHLYPLILHPNKHQFYLPNQVNGINFNNNEQIILSCPGTNNHLKFNNTINETLATCINNKTFQINNINYDFKEIQCTHYPQITAKYSSNNCSKIYKQINIGFITRRGFLLLYTNCFNYLTKDTLYSKFNLTSKIKTYQFFKRPSFKSLHFYQNLSTNPSIIYTKKYQQQRFQLLLGTSKYISLKSEFFLARGHLTAKADFVYSSQQRATFLYVNVAPQWQTFNGKNWMFLENSVRNFVATKSNDFIIYTGVFGIAKLPNVNGTFINLTLFSTEVFNVPQFFWKIIHDPISNKGIVFVGHNNPYEIEVKYYCTDICDEIDWVSWNRKNITAGFSYCCDYHEFKTIVDYVPQLPINGILI